jgi:ketol-acid reductoisomerase
VFEDIRNGGFAKRFQEEAQNGYPMLEFARAMINGGSPITEAEERIRQLRAHDPAPESA